MDRTELNDYLDQYEQITKEIVNGRRDLLTAEWGAKDDLGLKAGALLGSDNPQTGKPHSWTSAEKVSKESAFYRDQQIELQRMRGEIEINESKSRSLYILLQWMAHEPQAVAA